MYMQEKNSCAHCDPYPHTRSRGLQKFELLLFPAITLLTALERHLYKLLQKFPRLHLGLNQAISGGFFKTLLALKIFREVEAQDSDGGLYNRALVIVREARTRGITIKALKFLGKSTSHFSIEINGVKKILECLPHLFTAGQTFSVDFDDKGTLKELLKKAGLPHPEGRAFRHYAPALRYVQTVLGFPVVIKPRSGSLSKHTMCNIKTENQLREAIEIAQAVSSAFVVEKFIEGDVHRITLVNGHVVASCLREPPNVIGNGMHTIQELIKTKNQNPLRGEIHQKNFTLHKIIVSARTHSLLSSQNVTLQSIPPHGKKVYLHDKVILACGADVHDTTDMIHPENNVLFKKVYALCNTPLIGIDFITKDISKPHYEQECAVIEVNSLPYIDMHHYVVTGQKRNVAAHVLDYYLSCHKFS